MPFLFVDYDAGAGGEYFCSIVSQAPECVNLKNFITEKNRTKVIDRFNQQFLLSAPNIQPLESHASRYDVVPTHRQTELAQQLLGPINSIRIKNPTDVVLKNYIRDQLLSKVLLVTEPTDAMYIGFVKQLLESATNPNFLQQINPGMDNLSLRLVSRGIEPSDENRAKWADRLTRTWPEPQYAYDLIVPYEQLITAPDQIVSDLKKTFDITLDVELLQKYRTDFDAYYS